MYHHIAEGLLSLARSLKVSRVRRLTPNEIQTIEEGGLKLRATLHSLEDSRTANMLLQKQLDRLKEQIPEHTLLLNGEFIDG